MFWASKVAGRVGVGHLAGEEAGSDRVDADALPVSPLLGQVAGQADHAGLAEAYAACGRPAVVMPRTLAMLTVALPGFMPDSAARLGHQ